MKKEDNIHLIPAARTNDTLLQNMVRFYIAAQTLVVCGKHDEPKRSFLKREGLSCTSNWYAGELV